MTLTIAVAGKGGIGKTTLSALLVRALREMGIRPDSGRRRRSQLEPGRGPRRGRGPSLAEIREQSSSPEGSPSSGIGRVACRRRRNPARDHRGRRFRSDHDGPARRTPLLLRREQPAAEVARQPVAELRRSGGGQRGRHGASLPPHHQRRGLADCRDESDAAVAPGGSADRGPFPRVARENRTPRGAGQPGRSGGSRPPRWNESLPALDVASGLPTCRKTTRSNGRGRPERTYSASRPEAPHGWP